MKLKIILTAVFLMIYGLLSAKEMKIAILSNSGNQLYVRANNEIEVFSNGVLLGKKREVKFSAGKNAVTYEGQSYSDIILKPEGTDFLYISKSGKSFDGYRGNFDLIIENGRIVPVNLVEMDQYLYSVIPSEIGRKFPDEAVKAQIVTSRTYSYYNAKNSKFKNYDMVDNVNSQVYKGIAAEDEKINSLIDKTKNIVMTYKGEPINAIFHDDSGGFTANVQVFNSVGVKVRQLAANQLLSTNGYLTWDGRTDKGKNINPGIYVLYFEMFNAETGARKIEKLPVVVSAR